MKLELINFIEYSDDFTWDKHLHFPVPTLNYITKRTGENLLRLFDSNLEAEGKVLNLVRSARNYLFENRVDNLEQEYVIAHDIDRLYECLEYILEFINFGLLTGDYVDYFTLSKNDLNNRSIYNARQQFLGARIVLVGNKKFRDGY